MECTAVLFPLVWIVSAYWLGGVLPAVWVVRRLTGRTPEEWGDNPGGAGTLRLAGWRAAVPVVLFDVSKGLIPILLAAHFGWGDCWLVATAIAPVAGHNWPLQRGLRPGGKGLATAMGAGLYRQSPNLRPRASDRLERRLGSLGRYRFLSFIVALDVPERASSLAIMGHLGNCASPPAASMGLDKETEFWIDQPTGMIQATRPQSATYPFIEEKS